MLDLALFQLNLHTCISLVKVCRFRQCLGERFLPMYIFFSSVFLGVYRCATLSRFRCRHLKLCLLGFLKMLDLALSQIYIGVFYLWKSVDLDGV